MTASTASAYQNTSRRERRRARSCCSKKSKLRERDLRRLALLGRFGRVQELGGVETEHAGEDVVRKGLAPGVVFHHRVVERLARERHLVLGAGELFLDRQHVLVGLEVGVGLGEREQASEHAGERALGLAEALHRRRVARVGRRALRRGHRLIPGLDHRFERLALVLEVALDDFHQVRDQVVAPLELHVDLRERILVPVAQRDQAVVDADGPDGEPDDDDQYDPAANAHACLPLPTITYVFPRCRVARRSCARPNATASARQAAAMAIATSGIERTSMPSERSPVNSHPPAASAPRTATMSITFLALYFSSRPSTVNSTSRAGLEMAKLAVRCSAWKAITTASTGAAASTAKPAAITSGSSASAAPTPKRAISLPVAKNCTARVSRPTARSTAAKMRVRTAGSSDAAATIAACSK